MEAPILFVQGVSMLEIDQAANERLAQLMPQMMKAAGVTEPVYS